jgi:hypothetical protein
MVGGVRSSPLHTAMFHTFLSGEQFSSSSSIAELFWLSCSVLLCTEKVKVLVLMFANNPFWGSWSSRRRLLGRGMLRSSHTSRTSVRVVILFGSMEFQVDWSSLVRVLASVVGFTLLLIGLRSSYAYLFATALPLSVVWCFVFLALFPDSFSSLLRFACYIAFGLHPPHPRSGVVFRSVSIFDWIRIVWLERVFVACCVLSQGVVGTCFGLFWQSFIRRSISELMLTHYYFLLFGFVPVRGFAG